MHYIKRIRNENFIVSIDFLTVHLCPGFELTFESFIMKSSYKSLLVLVSPKYASWLGLRVSLVEIFLIKI